MAEKTSSTMYLGATVNHGDVVQIGTLEIPRDVEVEDISLILTDENGAEIPELPCEAEQTYYWLNGTVYDVLKWIAIVVLPALSWFYQSVGDIWGAPFVPQVSYTLAACGTFIAILIGASALKNKITKEDLGQ